MADQIQPSRQRITDANGDAVADAKAHIYETGTTTTVNVYTDDALTTPLANPVIADGGGLMPQIFYGGAAEVRVVITDSSDVEIFEIDPSPRYSSSTSAASDITVIPFSGVSATDVQAALEAVNANTLNLASPTFTGTVTSPVIRLTQTNDVTLASTDNAIQVGATGGQNLAVDINEMQSRNNGAASDLNFNLGGGQINMSLSGSNTEIRGTLTVDETATFDAIVANEVRADDGSATDPSFCRSTDQTTGYYFSTGGNPAVTISGVREALFESGSVANEADTVINRRIGDARYSQLGVGQTWQDVNGSRTVNTSYQNTEGTAIEVCIGASVSATGSTYQVSSDNSTWITLGVVGEEATPVSFVVPDDWYYRINRTGGGVFSLNYWTELR